MIPRNLTMIPRVRENSEVVIKFTQTNPVKDLGMSENGVYPQL